MALNIDSFLPEVKLNLPKIPKLTLKIDISDQVYDKNAYHWNTSNLPFSESEISFLPITDARFLTTGDVKTVIELSLKSDDDFKTLRAGDTIGILPENSLKEVESIVKILDLENKLKNVVTFSGTIPKHLPTKSCFKEIFTKFVDLRHIPKKILICHLSEYAVNESEKRRLQEICSREGSYLYSSEILDKSTTLLDLLYKYKSCKPPVELLLQHLPKLIPRAYSICNSPYVNPDVIKVCFSVVNKVNGVKGVTTGWLENLVLDIQKIKCTPELEESIVQSLEKMKIDDTKIPVYVRKPNTFRLPEDSTKPLIMIGPGTGVAPFIGFLEERLQNNSKSPALLYFGCRSPTEDYIYQDELERFVKEGVLTKLRVSFSRDGSINKYVQDNLLEDSEEIVKLIDDGSIIYICGDLNKIYQEMVDTLVACLILVKNIIPKEAEEIVNAQIIKDIWS